MALDGVSRGLACRRCDSRVRVLLRRAFLFVGAQPDVFRSGALCVVLFVGLAAATKAKRAAALAFPENNASFPDSEHGGAHSDAASLWALTLRSWAT